MNAVYISQVYLNFTPESKAHQVSAKWWNQRSKQNASTEPTIRLENRGLSKNTIDLLIALLHKNSSGSLWTRKYHLETFSANFHFDSLMRISQRLIKSTAHPL